MQNIRQLSSGGSLESEQAQIGMRKMFEYLQVADPRGATDSAPLFLYSFTKGFTN